VFSAAFDNPAPDRIRHVRVPAIKRPLALLFLSFHVSAALCYAFYCLTNKARFDLKQAVESNFSVDGVSYVHFCHRAFLKKHWPSSAGTGLRRFFRWLDHKLHALAEPWIFRRVRHIVVPSHGLARELSQEYPFTQDKIHIIANAVDVQRLNRPKDFDREAFRSTIGAEPNDVVLVFVALGQFERKGLPLLIDAFSNFRSGQPRLVVVGGTEDAIDVYRQEAASKGIGNKVVFTGMQQDVRPYLWAADGFVLPSAYEVFPLVALEAAAAGLPLITTKLYGVEEFFRDNENGIHVERSVEGLARGIRRFLSMSVHDRSRMGANSRQDVQKYAPDAFIAAWQRFYEFVLRR
jgi:glycosyltransferase involved in cell wall biosynthesis